MNAKCNTLSCDRPTASWWVAGERRSLFMTGDDDEVFMTINVTPKTTEQHLIVRSGKWSEAEITVWTVVQTVLTATFNSYGNRQISTPYKINTPEPIEKKFGTVDYVRERTPYTKFGTNPPTEGFWANGWNITKIIFIYLYLFFWDSRTGQTGWWIFTRNSSLDVKSRKDVPFWGY